MQRIFGNVATFAIDYVVENEPYNSHDNYWQGVQYFLHTMTINNESSNVNNGKLIHVKVSESKYFSILNAHIDLFWATEGGVLLLWLSLQNSIN